MNKLTKKLLISAGAVAAFCPSIILTSCHEAFVVDEEIKTHDVNGWQHAIEHIGSCKHPTLFLSQDASFYIQQIMNLYFASSQYAIQNNHTYKDKGYEYNDLILLVNGATWNYKENKPGPKAGYFSYDYSTVINSEYGFSDILANSKAVSNKINLAVGNQMLITNYQDFDLSLDKYDDKRSDYYAWYIETLKPIIVFVNKIMDLYEEIDPNIKFNYVLCDANWDRYFDSKALPGEILSENSEFERTLARMFKHADKFYLCSDGSYTWATGNYVYRDYYLRNGYTTARNQNGIMNLMHTLPFEQACKYFKYVNPYLWYNNEKFMVHFGPNTETCYSKHVLNESKHLTKETTCKYAAPWFTTYKYSSILTGNNFTNFEKAILKFYNSVSESGELLKFENFITEETRSHWKSDKKNLIFILSGAFRESRKPPEALWDECKKITAKIKENYPTDKWNYIYKLHPGTQPADADYILKKLLGIEEGQPVPDYCVVLNKVYPFEYLVSLDQTLVRQGIEENYHLIDPNTLDEDKPSGILTGFDLLSTCFYTPLAMLAGEYNMPWEKLNKLIQNDAYYMTRKYCCSDYTCVVGKDYSQINYNTLKKFYQLINDVGEFVDIDQFKFIE